MSSFWEVSLLLYMSRASTRSVICACMLTIVAAMLRQFSQVQTPTYLQSSPTQWLWYQHMQREHRIIYLARYPLTLQPGLHCAGDCDLAGDLYLPFQLEGFLLLKETLFVASSDPDCPDSSGCGLLWPLASAISGDGVSWDADMTLRDAAGTHAVHRRQWQPQIQALAGRCYLCAEKGT